MTSEREDVDNAGLPDAPAAEEPAGLPTGQDVGGLLNGLFDRPVTATEPSRPALRGRDVALVGSYTDDAGGVRAAVLCDLALGCGLGAALALLPEGRVQEARDAGEVPSDLADNTREVLNIAASLFDGGDVPLRLRDVQVAPEPVSADVVAFLRAAPVRRDVSVEIPGYGSGVLAVLLAG